MTKKQAILTRLKDNYLFAVIRGRSAEEATRISEAVFEGGIKNIEVTFTTPQADESIRDLARKFAGTDMVVGAGTVMDAITARIAIIAGAEFIVSPNMVPEISAVCNTYGIPYLPGCGTVTEVADALATGVEVVKVFPGGILGPAFIKNVHGPIPHVEMMPSGGVSLDNMDQWIDNGAWAVGIGSALTKDLKTQGYSSVTEQAQAFVQKYNEVK
ncbi:bifunctional 2-keto-4-hydroxyglutarate aldolase/2-keto-3-deoxy-6-phosphogluconate aldolase [Alkalibacterium pelagium]|jgi:2-dehydro-3-deoxyphosphogluconate aldolase/(4S)-4-hydroxy-2-oxoglutarate aldolase|uniref:2-dehydro-3-deoxyphosphogluconate aldolase / (4S)-4-hydroxy-2-oxoglutarate aldolase n=1 Tax=Alkalibacterium pelagium TaxID=426702 RepID=A0A1H7LLL9_9LACT|nr:bifunctional 2-keto-4-hydroxyglutarate aldolase/2-keto-3-deoxy-6-phosphogluconate aldolase [Alkalibacterium pelagium]GEN50845.1 bifunctional 2-keto-4-hydroxyglutarate aldolase/2-keto-3-deoxy-6-phosphogluconate aldolase [Alkalibacterium pelagium]SEK99820.1 2-dehydro-3-deoxyphosphogluconate aldolase / (4S)-4-hydroxy-2-oxoglutarate aldolase [Alkalibacterium pelagium]